MRRDREGRDERRARRRNNKGRAWRIISTVVAITLVVALVLSMLVAILGGEGGGTPTG